MIRAWLQARTAEWHALAEAQERVQQGKVTLEIGAGGASGDGVRRQTPAMVDLIAEFDKRYGRR